MNKRGRIMLDYARKYNNVSFEEMPFNIVDGVILSQLSYYDYEGTDFEKRVLTDTIGACLYEKDPAEFVHKMMNARGDEELIRIVRDGKRFGSLRAAGYIDDTSVESDRQFAAITFELGNNEFYIAFRGTDKSVVGWKEDFNWMHQDEIASHEYAERYTKKVMDIRPGKFYLGGHSKGGHLAAYTSIMLPQEYQDRLLKVFNFDGPGYTKEVYELEAYKRMKPRIHKVVPQGGFIGLMMERDNHYQVVKCDAELMEQHSPFNWKIKEHDFDWTEKIDDEAEFIINTLNKWIKDMNMEDRKVFCDTLFGFLNGIGITNFDKTYRHRKGKVRDLVNRLRTADAKNRRRTLVHIARLVKVTAGELREAIAEREE